MLILMQGMLGSIAHSHFSPSKPFVNKNIPSKLNMSNAQRAVRRVIPFRAGSLGEAVISMESDSDKRAKESSLRERRYAIRYPFAAYAEMLELESGTMISGVTSDLSPGGCFVCVRRPLKIGARRGQVPLFGGIHKTRRETAGQQDSQECN